LVHFASRHSVIVHAADWATNMPVFTNLPAHATYVNTGVLPVELPVRAPPSVAPSTEATAAPVKENVHTVSFLVTDGDNVSQSI
jgi:hypothetical protein